MNILVVTQYYFPEQFRINDICECLVKRGHSVTVLTGLPNYPDGEIFDGYRFGEKNNECHNGVNIIRCKIRPRHSGSLNLIRNYLSFSISVSKHIDSLSNDYDVIYVYQLSPVTLAIPALKYKKKYNKPLFLYCCDIWPESVRDTDGKPMSVFNPIYLIAKWISKRIYNKADRIGVKCNQFIDYLSDVCKVNKDKCVLIYEHAEDTYLKVSEEPNENGCYDFMFIGNIGLSQHCDYLVKAIEKICIDDSYKVHFVGSGSGCNELKSYVANRNLSDKVIFHGRYPVSEINQFYEMADCCVLTLSANTAVGLTPPAKLTGYMAASRPVIAAAKGATKDIISEARCGICVDPDDIHSLAESMQYAVLNSKEFQALGSNGREYFLSHFTLSKHIDDLEKELIKLVAKQEG